MASKKSEKNKQKRLAKKKAARKQKQKAQAKSSTPELRLIEGGAEGELPFALPDPRAMEAGLRDLFGFGSQESNADSEAQDLMYQAFEEDDAAKRIGLARQALEVSPDCADAYCLLAQEDAPSIEEAIKLLQEGVAAGERLLGPDAFEGDVGHFWGLIETRPYMRARADLAQCLWASGKQSEAVGHYRELLRLNPNDNQGNRDVLVVHLIELGEDAEAADLFDKYPDDAGASSVYGKALLAFRREGDSEAAREALDAAIAQNEHVPALLLGKKRLPNQLPPYMGFGDENEAVHYVATALSGWDQTPDAHGWLGSRVKLAGGRA
ncbi:MAG: hypothetical protein DRJ42_21200 [Deltaproteobacteria bacterium]|nr:MAG: hypothetical protein DRJ42_21200 [Deltaproteobacteria bacterium]